MTGLRITIRLSNRLARLLLAVLAACAALTVIGVVAGPAIVAWFWSMLSIAFDMLVRVADAIARTVMFLIRLVS